MTWLVSRSWHNPPRRDGLRWGETVWTRGLEYVTLTVIEHSRPGETGPYEAKLFWCVDDRSHRLDGPARIEWIGWNLLSFLDLPSPDLIHWHTADHVSWYVRGVLIATGKEPPDLTNAIIREKISKDPDWQRWLIVARELGLMDSGLESLESRTDLLKTLTDL